MTYLDLPLPCTGQCPYFVPIVCTPASTYPSLLPSRTTMGLAPVLLPPSRTTVRRASRIRAGCLWSGPAPHGCHRTQPTPKSDAELRRHPRPWPVQAHVRVAAGPGPPGRKARVSHVWGAAPAHPSRTPPCARRDVACAAHQGPSFTIPPPASQQSPARARRVPQRI